MKQYFAVRGNRPASIAAIAAGAKVNQSTVQSILYKRNRGRFAQVNPSGGAGHPSLWRMVLPSDPAKPSPSESADVFDPGGDPGV